MTKPILILDDDVHFRSLVAGLFQTRGYEVFECRTTKEAQSVFAETDPGLAIVDYRLPESDGITWISWLRESGRNFPVVFCSGTWCDEKTFNWLRNILRVSLILRKPIVPELFIQQIENLMPPPPVSTPKEEFSIIPPLKPNQFVAPVTAEELKLQIEKIDAAISKSSPESPTHAQLVSVRGKLVVQQMLAEAKQAYALDLPVQWQAMSEAVAQTQAGPENKIALDQAIQLSHRIRGTAGAMGFREAGDSAGKVEDLLRRFDPTDTLTEVLWTEIFRALAEGEVSVRGLSLVVGGKKTQLTNFVSNVLFLCRPENFEKQIEELANAKIEALVCDSVDSALTQAKSKKIDAALFDLTAADDAQIFKLATQIREAAPGKPIGLAFISAGQNAPDEAALAYAGSSSFLWSPVPALDLVENVQRLTRLGGGGGRSKVLTVDDDDALTNFIQTILGGENIEVAALNKPIQILNVVEQFQPDLILLDVMMPGLSGYDVCRLLRATDKWAHVPILFLTSRSDADGRASAFQAGATDFLSKPILAPELVARVRAHLSQSQRNTGDKGRDGLVDRKEFIESARSMIAASKSSQNDMALCLMLVDDLLNLSIAHGLNGAEAVEKTLGDLLRVHFKAESLRARWGEGGFALAVPGESRTTITEAMQKMSDDFCSIVFANEQQVAFRASFSAGLSGVPGDELTIENLMNMANIRM